jgi:hypothetical protein
MPIHDWTRVEAATFHDFHCSWTVHLKDALNQGRLPAGYYAQAEQHVGRKVADVLALHVSDPEQLPSLPEPSGHQAVAVAEAPPLVDRTLALSPSPTRRRRTLTIRHTTGHRIVALIEIVSRANKASETAMAEFVQEVDAALRAGIHVVVLDILPAGRYDPLGMHGAIVEEVSTTDEEDELPEGQPLVFASYAADVMPTAYVKYAAVGDPVPPMPLFLTTDRYVELPLESSYRAAYAGVPEFWRDVLEGRRPAPEQS